MILQTHISSSVQNISSCLKRQQHQNFSIHHQQSACSTFLPKMQRKLSLARLFFAYLLLAASQSYYSKTTMVQAIASVNFQLRTAQLRSRMAAKHILATQEKTKEQVQQMKIHKTPSGPNPIGHHHPPSRQ